MKRSKTLLAVALGILLCVSAYATPTELPIIGPSGQVVDNKQPSSSETQSDSQQNNSETQNNSRPSSLETQNDSSLSGKPSDLETDGDSEEGTTVAPSPASNPTTPTQNTTPSSATNPTMPSSSSQSQQQSSPTSFTDVNSGDYYAAPVAWAVEKGITNGVDATRFAPTSPCNRAQMVTFLWRAAGSPEPKGSAAKFADVAAGAYYAKAVAWAVEYGVTLGTSATTFEPSAPVSRAQAVTFLWRAQGKPSATAGDTYADVEAGSYYEQAVQWAAAKNVTKGTGNGFEPSTTVNRAMSVTFLYRTYVGA